MESWNKYLFHSLRSEWEYDYGLENNRIDFLIKQIVTLQLILEYQNIYSYNNIKNNIDLNYANKIYWDLLLKYCEIGTCNGIPKSDKFQIQRNNITNNGNNHVSLIPKYVNGKRNNWFDIFCWGCDYINSGESLHSYHPFRICINIICSDKIHEECEIRSNRVEQYIPEVQVVNEVPSKYFKGIAIGTNLNNEEVNEKYQKYHYNYIRRLNLVMIECTRIINEFAPNLKLYDLLTEQEFSIPQDKIIPQKILLAQKFNNNMDEQKFR